MSDGVRNVTLALSGGGLRAALFHLGVIAYLRESQTIDRVKRIFAISGGSIFAAHLSRNWNSCLSSSSDEEFRKAAISLVKFCQSDLRGKLVRRQLLFFAIVMWLLAVPPSFIAVGSASTALAVVFTIAYLVVWLFAAIAFRPFVDWKSHGILRKVAYTSIIIVFAVLPILAYWLQPVSFLKGKWFILIWLALLAISVRIFWTDFSLTNYLLLEYDQFFHTDGQPATLRQLQADQNSPEVHLIATSYTSGQIVWFDSTGVTIYQAKHPPIKSNRTSLKLSYGVAASSAFPPAFPPVKMTPRLLAVDTGDLRHPEFLGDGGIYDNLGVEASFIVDKYSGNELLISSAEQRFDVDVDSSFFLLPSRAARATDVLMSRASEMTRKNASLLPNHKLIALATELPPDWLDTLVQQGVRNLRTDLDRFSDVEVQTLYYYGYCAAAVALRGEGQEAPKVKSSGANVPLGTEQFWLPIKSDSREIQRADEYTLDRGAALKLGIWRWSDWKSWATLLVLLATLMLSHPALAYYRSIPVIPNTLRFESFKVASFKWPTLRQQGNRTSTVERIIRTESGLTVTGCAPDAVKDRAILFSQRMGSLTKEHPIRTFELLVELDRTKIDRFRCSAFAVYGDNAAIEQLELLAANDTANYRFLVPASSVDTTLVLIVSYCSAPDVVVDLKKNLQISPAPFQSR